MDQTHTEKNETLMGSHWQRTYWTKEFWPIPGDFYKLNNGPWGTVLERNHPLQ